MTRMARYAAGVLLLLALPLAVYADVSVQGGPIGSSSNPIKTVTVTSNTSSAGDFSANKTIVGFKLIPTAANAICGLFDTATLGANAATNMIDELREATSSETSSQLWPTPYRLSTDLSVGVTNGICIVYYY